MGSARLLRVARGETTPAGSRLTATGLRGAPGHKAKAPSPVRSAGALQIPDRRRGTPWTLSAGPAPLRLRASLILLTLLFLAVAPAPLLCAAEDSSARLQRGLFEEEANQNLDAAITAYQSVLTAHDEQRKLAATALFRLGECYRKLRRTNDAIAQYRRLLSEFADQSTLAPLCEQNLAGLGVPRTNPPGSNERLQQTAQAAQEDDQTKEIRRLEALSKESPDLINTGRTQGVDGHLQTAVSLRRPRVVTFLLDRGADIEQADGKGNTALSLAVAAGNREMVELLLARGARVNVRMPDSKITTPLMRAADQGYKAIVETLLDHGAEIHTLSGQGLSALHLAARGNKREVVETLLAHGASVNLKDSSGVTPLGHAVSAEQVAMVQLLIQRSADVNAGPTNQSVLAIPVGQSDEPMTALLLTNGANPNQRFTWDMGSPPRPVRDVFPLLLAAERDSVSILAMLLKAGADPKARDGDGSTALLHAVGRSREEAAELLLKAGADPEMPDSSGSTPLGLAVLRGNLAMVRLLIDHHANPNGRVRDYRVPTQMNSYTTPLHLAGVWGHRAILDLLVEHGANLLAVDDHGQTLLDLVTPPNARITPRSSEFAQATITPPELEKWLRLRGLNEYTSRPGWITLCRVSSGFRFPLWRQDTNGVNRSTLLELLAEIYLNDSHWPALQWPDLADVRLVRKEAATGKPAESHINALELLDSPGATNDIPLEWGDVVEIQEADHISAQLWQGLGSTRLDAIRKRLSRTVEIVVKGETNRFTLLPASAAGIQVGFGQAAFVQVGLGHRA